MEQYSNVQVRYAVLDFTTANVHEYSRVWNEYALDTLDVGILGQIEFSKKIIFYKFYDSQ